MGRTESLELMLTVGLFLNTMVIFLFMKNKRNGWLDISALITFVAYWVALLFVGESINSKILGTLNMLMVVIIRFYVARKNPESG